MISDALNYLHQGGYVIYPLMGVSVWMWYLIVKKLIVLAWWRKHRPRRNKLKTSEGQTVMAEFEARKTSHPAWDRRLLRSLIDLRKSELERHIQTIFVLASVAPLLGLLGTVTGMISTFEAISRFGTANARALASGISQALITTQAGLVVAIPGLFMGHYIRRRADNIQMRLNRFYLNKSKLL